MAIGSMVTQQHLPADFTVSYCKPTKNPQIPFNGPKPAVCVGYWSRKKQGHSYVSLNISEIIKMLVLTLSLLEEAMRGGKKVFLDTNASED